MKINNLIFAAFVAVVLAVYTNGSPCGTSGMSVVKANDGGLFVIYSFREGPDVAFQIPGKEISFPNGTTGPKRFNIDGVIFETLFVNKSEFLKTSDPLIDVEVLKKHREYEVSYITKAGGPLSKLIELG